MRVEVIGEIESVGFHPENRTVTLKGEYGAYEFIATDEKLEKIESACETIREYDEE